MPTASKRSQHLDRSALPAPEVIRAAHEMLSALADPNRLRLLCCLATGERSVGELAGATDMLESTTSHALRVLRLHGMVTSRREGRSVYYSLADDHVSHMLEDVLDHVRHGVGNG